jgi:VIT1/CCC1 family predicted Fe2+/Mn2+ transporter
MPDQSTKKPNRPLDPQERFSEILFGLIMALTVTNSLGIAQHGHAEVRTLAAGALGCNLAWGAIDAVMYLMAQLTERGRDALTLRMLHQVDAGEARSIIAQALPPILAAILRADEFDAMRERLIALPQQSGQPHLEREDWLAAGGVFLLVFLSTLPVVVPFAFIGNAWLALQVSNAVAVGMLFLGGHALSRYSGNHPWKGGLLTVLVGIALVGLAIALGG